MSTQDYKLHTGLEFGLYLTVAAAAAAAYYFKPKFVIVNPKIKDVTKRTVIATKRLSWGEII